MASRSAYSGRPSLPPFTGYAEIGPVDMIVRPRRIPLRVEIQTEIGIPVAGVGIPGVE
jgi:hypothetical protein